MTYEWKCRNCGHEQETQTRAAEDCPVCHLRLKRKYSVHTPHPNHFFQPHFNHTVGSYVTSMKHFKDELKRGNEKMNDRGYPSNFEPVDPYDRVGVKDLDG